MKKRVSIFLMSMLVLQIFIQPVIASSSVENNSINLTNLNREKEFIMLQIEQQLIEQDRLDHLKYYEYEVDKLLGINEVCFNNDDYILYYSSRSSNLYAPRGGAGKNSNRYATTTYVYIPNNMILEEIANKSDGLSSWAVKAISAPFSLIDGAISAYQTSQLRRYHRNGESVIKIHIVDHSENDITSNAYMQWSNYPYMSGDYDRVSVR